MLRRVSVNADNNCLFTSFAYVCEGLSTQMELRAAARRLRRMCSSCVLEDPEPEMRSVLLGFDSVSQYSEWILDETHWGGEPELLMLTQHFDTEVALVSCETMRVTKYGGTDGANTRPLIFLLYTGQHYDPLVLLNGEDQPHKLGVTARGDNEAALCAAAVEIARQHVADAAKRAAERRVKRLRCGGCGALLASSAAFQAHCGEVEHDDDFMYDCEEVELVINDTDELPPDSIDLESPTVHAFYNAASATVLSLSMACSLAPFMYEGVEYPSLEALWRSEVVATTGISERASLLLDALRAQFGGDAARKSGLISYLLSTGDVLIACVDLDPWLGVQAAGGISTGENRLGKAYMTLRSELQQVAPAPQ